MGIEDTQWARVWKETVRKLIYIRNVFWVSRAQERKKKWRSKSDNMAGSGVWGQKIWCPFVGCLCFCDINPFHHPKISVKSTWYINVLCENWWENKGKVIFLLAITGISSLKWLWKGRGLGMSQWRDGFIQNMNEWVRNCV